MQAEQAQAPRTGGRQWPTRKRCRHCQQEILRARDELTGKVIQLEPWTALIGDWPCSPCRSTGQRLVAAYAVGRGRSRTGLPGDLADTLVRGTRTSCPDCGGTGNQGVEFDPRVHVVMSIEGLVRPAGAVPVAWDSVHRLHVCQGA